MDQLLSNTEEVLGLNDMKEMWASTPGQTLNLSTSEEEMNELLGSSENEPSPSTSSSTGGVRGETGIDLESKLKLIEKEREKEKSLIEKLRRENKELKEKSKDEILPFGLEPERFLAGDIKESTAYLAKIIIPRIKRVVDENKEIFKLIYALGEVSEPVDYRAIRTCVLFNRGRPCREGYTHRDPKGNKRIHACTICWEVLWIFVAHRVVTCPLLTRKFYSKLGAKITP